MKRFSIAILLISVASIAYGQSEVGGTNAPDGQYPYQAALKRKSKFLCGASIINKRWLLTAAHCTILIKSVDEATVMVGSNKVSGFGGTVYAVKELVQHEDYDKGFIHANDIALIRVNRDIAFSKKVKPVKLAKDESKTYENATAILAGWGTFGKDGIPENLQHIKLHVISNARCSEEWKEARKRDIKDSQLCTSGKKEENLATHGDSGGPLVSDGVQIGLVSFAWENLPDVFTRVSAYLSWINKHVSNN